MSNIPLPCGIVVSVNCSAQRGTAKQPVAEAQLRPGRGLIGDAHGDGGDREVSIFPLEALALMPASRQAEIAGGQYTENLTISGLSPDLLNPGARLRIGGVVVEIMLVGKPVLESAGRPYAVSRAGRFGRVRQAGTVRPGDSVQLLAAGLPPGAAAEKT